jgi:hypothetical protein
MTPIALLLAVCFFTVALAQPSTEQKRGGDHHRPASFRQSCRV